VTRLSTELAKFNDTLDKLGAVIQRQSARESGRIEILENQIKNQGREQSAAAAAIDRRLQEINRKIEIGGSSNLSRDVNELSGRVAALNSSLSGGFHFPEKRWSLRTILGNLRW
jgi:hypothetical protein